MKSRYKLYEAVAAAWRSFEAAASQPHVLVVALAPPYAPRLGPTCHTHRARAPRLRQSVTWSASVMCGLMAFSRRIMASTVASEI